jgi:hypothetical protein
VGVEDVARGLGQDATDPDEGADIGPRPDGPHKGGAANRDRGILEFTLGGSSSTRNQDGVEVVAELPRQEERLARRSADVQSGDNADEPRLS